jgi:hypothetical protein
MIAALFYFPDYCPVTTKINRHSDEAPIAVPAWQDMAVKYLRALIFKEEIMRSTRASAAVERLKARSGNAQYSMVRSADGMFHLVLDSDAGVREKLSDPLELDAFVKFVNAYGPQKPKRVSKLDVAFEKQLTKKSVSE